MLEPSIPAAKQEVVSLYDTIDRQALICNVDELRELFAANANYHERAARFISAAGALYCDAHRGAARCMLEEKVAKYALGLQKKLLPPTGAKPGAVTVRLSSAVTPKGIVSYAHDNSINNERVYLLDDKFAAAGQLLLCKLRDAAVAAGYDVVESRCPMSPYDKLELLEIPALSLCFTLISFFAPVRIETAKKVNMLRFYDKEKLAQTKNRMSFSRRATLQLLTQASVLIAEAKAVHDKIEDVYKSNVDFSVVRAKEQQILVDLALR